MSYITASEAAVDFQTSLLDLLSKERGVDVDSVKVGSLESIPLVVSSVSERLREIDKVPEADALHSAHEKITSSATYNGLGLNDNDVPTEAQFKEAIFLCEAWLESVKSQESSRNFTKVNTQPVQGAKPMTLAQKIFTQHALGSKTAEHGLSLGDVVRVGVDWVIASELSWAGMASMYEEIGSPGIWRNDRLWIAGDHVVHPTITDQPKIKMYIDKAEKAKRDFKMVDYQGMNVITRQVKAYGSIR